MLTLIHAQFLIAIQTPLILLLILILILTFVGVSSERKFLCTNIDSEANLQNQSSVGEGERKGVK